MKRRAVGLLIAVILGLVAMPALAATWDLRTTFQHSTWNIHDDFGLAIAGAGGNVLVGAPNFSTGQTGTGDAYLYTRNGQLLRQFQNPVGDVNDAFGYSAASLGNGVLVGAPWAHVGSTSVGAVYEYDSTGTFRRAFRPPTITSPDDFFGVSIATSGNYVFIGAKGVDGPAADTGAVYVYDSDTGNLVRRIVNPSGAGYEMFGSSIAVVGDNLLVGAPGKFPGTGAAYLVDVQGNQILRFAGPAGAEYLGTSVAAYGHDLLMGAPSPENPGTAYLYDTATGTYRTFRSPSPDPTDSFGFAVAAVGDNILVGAYRDMTNGVWSGSVYVLDSNGAVSATLTDPRGVGSMGMGFGNSLALLGNDVLVGGGSCAWLLEGPGSSNVVPEPCTLIVWSLLGASGVGLGWWRRKRAAG